MLFHQSAGSFAKIWDTKIYKTGQTFRLNLIEKFEKFNLMISEEKMLKVDKSTLLPTSNESADIRIEGIEASFTFIYVPLVLH